MISFHITELHIICNYIYVYVLPVIASIKYMLLQEEKGKKSERVACMTRIFLGYKNFITFMYTSISEQPVLALIVLWIASLSNANFNKDRLVERLWLAILLRINYFNRS